MPESLNGTFFRVDPRLVHATLMSGWVPSLGLERLVIACRDVAADRRLATICRMSAMDQVLVRCVREDQVVEALGEVRLGCRQMVLFASLAGVERALDSGLQIDALNVGHLPRADGTKMLVPAVHLGAEDRAAIDRLTERGIRVYVQPLADDDPRDPLTDELSTSDLQIPADLLSEPELPPDAGAPEIKDDSKDRVAGVLEVVNERGLHLRAASVLAQFAGKLAASVEVGKGGDFVNAKSLLGLTTLGAGPGTKLDVVVTGPGAKDAFEALRGLFARGFEEGVGRGNVA